MEFAHRQVERLKEAGLMDPAREMSAGDQAEGFFLGESRAVRARPDSMTTVALVPSATTLARGASEGHGRSTSRGLYLIGVVG